MQVICLLDEESILGGGKSKANTSSLWGRWGDRLYCSINSYNMGEGRMIRVWFFHSCIPRPSLVICSFVLGSPHHRQYDLNNSNLFPTILETKSSRSRCSSEASPGRLPSMSSQSLFSVDTPLVCLCVPKFPLLIGTPVRLD